MNSFSRLCFYLVIAAWAKSRKFGKAARARALLDKMISLYESGTIESRPNIHCYTAVINACAHCENDTVEKRDALKIFVDTYKEMTTDSSLQLNNVTFSSVLTALSRLLPNSKQRMSAVATVFRKCADEGMCDKLVIKKLESLLDKDALKNIIGAEAVAANGKIDDTLLPSEWSCNINP
jgi:hypothetical protein